MKILHTRPPRPGGHFGIEGRFRIEVVRRDSGIITRTLEFANLVTDAGLDGLGGGTIISNLINYLAVGTDSTAPDVTDTSLGAEVKRAADDGGFADVHTVGPSNTYHEVTRTRVLSFTGNVNLTELGFLNASSGGILFNRQLFRDDLGDPTTLTVLDEEELRVIYAWRIYIPTSEITDSLTIDGVSTTVTTRAYDVDSNGYDGDGIAHYFGGVDTTMAAFEENAMPLLAAAQTPSQVNSDSSSAASYVAGTFYRDMTGVWEPASANFATGIGSVICWQYGPVSDRERAIIHTFSPKIQKDDTMRFSWTSRMNYARYSA